MKREPDEQKNETPSQACAAEILTTGITQAPIGYRFGGSRTGPNALVAGDTALIDALAQRLVGVPILPWIRGSLYIVEIDKVEGLDLQDVRSSLVDVELDDWIVVPHLKDFSSWQESVDEAYWATLRLMTGFGMINGRGVPG